ncbi:MAG: M6 family metalloprotease domain-containing protein [Candidatus Zixiibacteriota bacterium]
MKPMNTIGRTIARGLFACILTITTTSVAAPPHERLFDSNRSAALDPPYFLSHLDEMHAKGICTADDFMKKGLANKINRDGLSLAPTATPFRVLALLVKFSDHANSVSATFFDSLCFDSANSSVRNYYGEISYSQIDLVTVNLPSSVGWTTAPQTYAYYVDGKTGTGGVYPRNSQKLVEDVVDAVNGVVNFANYDNDGDGYVDVLLVIHSGTGAEFSGSNNDIWSHKWAITPRLKDSVYIRDFTVQPEFWSTAGDMTIGVYAHELGHGFGLPDLYDTDYSSKGVGKWCLMSYGSWNGPGGLGASPSHPSAWSRIQMGMATSTNVVSNVTGQSILNVESGGPIYRLWTSGGASQEHFLVENRQKTGYDAYIPNDGLLIWHIDDAKTNNTKEDYPGDSLLGHYLVALEQADGLFELDKSIDNGDAGDIYPGTTSATSFNALSTPSSNSYSGGSTFVGVENISASALTMTADLIVGFAAATDDGDNPLLPSRVDLSQNYPNPFNPSTTIEFSVPEAGWVSLEVFNVTGQRVATLLREYVSAAVIRVDWDGRAENGQPLASGIYLYRLETEESSLTRKMVLLK